MTSSDSNSNKPKQLPSHHPFRKKGITIFGLGGQDFIRYFFGGNASLAIIILILICVFLLREGIMFFPDHHKGLKEYRLAGQELVDLVGEEIDKHTQLYSSANVAYFAEVNRTSEEEDELLRAHRSVKANIEKITKKTWGRLELRLEEQEDLQEEIEDLQSKADTEESAPKTLAQVLAEREGRPPAGVTQANPTDTDADAAKMSEEEKARLDTAKKRLEVVESNITELREKLKKEVEAALDSNEAWDMGVGGQAPPKSEVPKLREAVFFEAFPDAEEEHAYIRDLKKVSKEKKAAEAESLASFKETLNEIQSALRPLRDFHKEIKDISLENKTQIVSFSTAPARRAALLKGARATEDPTEKAALEARAEDVEVTEPDYAKLNAPIYEKIPQHEALAGTLLAETKKQFEALPDEKDLETKSARQSMDRAGVYLKRFENSVENNVPAVERWRHDKPMSVIKSTTAFLFGKNWVTNSSWHDFYGLLPLFSGSLLISIIALVVAVPFSVSAAIYVNQLASAREQNFVKPAIEFIEAIPSVVLGFFGILVFGETLRAVSQIEWLSWVPGFPMSERLTILNAGLLLALMAIPTIFTLAEDALNNVPGAMTENSLAMGATKLQTVFRVIVPSALSGMIAAVLLGFGRIIGETMVVLLVAGNKIKIPDFTEGIGVIAQPAHTMTGIIAQELGEVDAGSLHWRALFIIGMVLFVISLLVNFSAQKVLKKFQKF